MFGCPDAFVLCIFNSKHVLQMKAPAGASGSARAIAVVEPKKTEGYDGVLGSTVLQ